MSKSNAAGSSAYFIIFEPAGGEHHALVTFSHSTMPCEHVMSKKVSVMVRGANGKARWFTCRECSEKVCNADRSSRVDNWEYLFMSLVLGPQRA